MTLDLGLYTTGKISLLKFSIKNIAYISPVPVAQW